MRYLQPEMSRNHHDVRSSATLVWESPVSVRSLSTATASLLLRLPDQLFSNSENWSAADVVAISCRLFGLSAADVALRFRRWLLAANVAPSSRSESYRVLVDVGDREFLSSRVYSF